MIVNPNDIYLREILTGVQNPQKQIQQNGIDITLKRVYRILPPSENNGVCLLTETNRILPNREEVISENGMFKLKEGVTYDIEFNEQVKIPQNMNWTLVQRSSLNRMWAYFSCGVYDSWYEWRIWAILRPSLDIMLEVNTRLAQFVFTFADGNWLYQGRYKKGNSHDSV